MVGPISQEALCDALAIENHYRKKMSDRSSQEILLDEEGIALKDLSHQRSLRLNNAKAGPNVSQSSIKTVPREHWSSSRLAGEDHTHKRHGSDVTLAMGRVYRRMGKMSCIPRYFLYIVPVGIVIAVPIIVGAFLPYLELGVYS